MTIVRDLNLHRKRIGTADQTTPEELLQILLEDVRMGHEPGDNGYGVWPIKKLIVIAVSQDEHGNEGVETYRCQMSWPEAVGYMEAAQFQQVMTWRNIDQQS